MDVGVPRQVFPVMPAFLKVSTVKRLKGSFCTAQFRDGNIQNTQHRRKAQTLGDTIVPGLDVGNVNQRGYPSHRD